MLTTSHFRPGLRALTHAKSIQAAQASYAGGDGSYMRRIRNAQ
jgi:hypothetical protein